MQLSSSCGALENNDEVEEEEGSEGSNREMASKRQPAPVFDEGCPTSAAGWNRAWAMLPPLLPLLPPLLPPILRLTQAHSA
jgi:hypothetical protein